MVGVRLSDIHGRCVFANVAIPEGSELVCDVLLTKGDDLKDYQYPWGKGISSICMGFGSFLNHSSTDFNLRIYRIDKTHLTKYFVATRDIEIDEELLINYGRKLTI